MSYHFISIEETCTAFETDISNGLSRKEVGKRQKKYGFNLLKSPKKKSFLSRFVAQLKDFMILILVIAAVVSFFVSLLEGHADFLDPIIIFAIILFNAFLGVLQETKAEKSLEALKGLSAPLALVQRDGQCEEIPAKELVPGDIIFLETGHFVPADARLITSVNLKVEEAALTGESHPVTKEASSIYKKETLLGDRKNMVLSSSLVRAGRGSAIVTATGMDTEVGHIATMIMDDDTPDTPLQKRLEKTGKVLGIAALLICACIFVLGVLQKKSIFPMFMTSVSLAVAAIPEGLPAVVTIMLSLGVQRMAKKNAVIRSLPAVETLGCATIICSDKTGTLTANEMTVTQLCSIHGTEDLTGSFSRYFFTLAAKCNNSKININNQNKGFSITGEPTENALLSMAYQQGISKEKLDLLAGRIFEIPFDSGRKLMTTIHKGNSSASYESVTKGAPDVLLPLCSHYYDNGKIVPLNDLKRQQIINHNRSMAEDALRVIGVAFKTYDILPKDYQNRTSLLENHLTFIGLAGMIDPPRPEVADAVAMCKSAGIKPIMITGDHIGTACAIGKQLGFIHSDQEAIHGKELNRMTSGQLREQITHYSVFARVSPEHKVRIVKAFQGNGHVVAMTGDGINDAPALKTADIGCAMGKGGTDVAKNAADMILMDDNFATIVSAVQEGRGIYDNIQKAIHFLLSSNIGEIITIFTAIFFGLSSPLLAVQLLWVNLVTDSLPALALGVEPPEKDIMKRPPLSPKAGLFSKQLIFQIVTEGMMIGFLALTAFILGCKLLPGHNLTLGRTMCFAVLSLSQICHSFNMRSRHSLFKIGLFTNPKLWLSFFVCTFLQIIVISYAPLASLFKVMPLPTIHWMFVGVLSLIPLFIVELQKSFNH